MSPVDMSPRAIEQRLRLASELRRLCLTLGEARPVGLVESGDDLIRDADSADAEGQQVAGENGDGTTRTKG
jgi:hypothetical protein